MYMQPEMLLYAKAGYMNLKGLSIGNGPGDQKTSSSVCGPGSLLITGVKISDNHWAFRI